MNASEPLVGSKRWTADEESQAVQNLYSIKAEKAVLGSMLGQPDEVIDEVTQWLSRQDFFVEAHQIIFDALVDMHENGSAIEVMVIHDYLTNTKEANRVGSPEILGELLTGYASHLNVSSYVSIVKNKSKLRNLHAVATSILQKINAGPESVPTLLTESEALIFDQTQIKSEEERPFSQVVASVAEEAIDWANQGGGIRGHTTGFPKLDSWINGWRPQQLVVIGASMGGGKTSLGLTFLRHLIKDGHACGMFSEEMGNQQISIRILSGEACIGSRSIFQGSLGVEQQSVLRKTAEKLSSWPFYLDCTSGIDIQQIRSRARRWKRKYAIEYLLIDYAQITRSKRFSDNKTLEVADVARNAKEMARELNLTVFLLSQLNCAVDEAPNLTNFKETKTLAEEADIALLLSRQKIENEGNSQVFCLHLAKQREGQMDLRMTLDYQAWKTHFREKLPEL